MLPLLLCAALLRPLATAEDSATLSRLSRTLQSAAVREMVELVELMILTEHFNAPDALRDWQEERLLERMDAQPEPFRTELLQAFQAAQTLVELKRGIRRVWREERKRQWEAR